MVVVQVPNTAAPFHNLIRFIYFRGEGGGGYVRACAEQAQKVHPAYACMAFQSCHVNQPNRGTHDSLVGNEITGQYLLDTIHTLVQTQVLFSHRTINQSQQPRAQVPQHPQHSREERFRGAPGVLVVAKGLLKGLPHALQLREASDEVDLRCREGSGCRFVHSATWR